MATHLTIDIDFWTMLDDHIQPPEEGVRIFRRLATLGKPVHVVRYHHHVVHHIPDRVSRLVNIDTHDDYPRAIVGRICEGSWASPQFLPWVRDYTWITNYKETECCTYHPYHDLKFRRHRRIIEPRSIMRCIPWKDLHSATICLSPNWAEYHATYRTLAGEAIRLFGKPKTHGEPRPRTRRC